MGGWVGGWLENEFLKKIPSSKFGIESLLGTFDFGVCQFEFSIRLGCLYFTDSS